MEKPDLKSHIGFIIKDEKVQTLTSYFNMCTYLVQVKDTDWLVGLYSLSTLSLKYSAMKTGHKSISHVMPEILFLQSLSAMVEHGHDLKVDVLEALKYAYSTYSTANLRKSIP